MQQVKRDSWSTNRLKVHHTMLLELKYFRAAQKRRWYFGRRPLDLQQSLMVFPQMPNGALGFVSYVSGGDLAVPGIFWPTSQLQKCEVGAGEARARAPSALQRFVFLRERLHFDFPVQNANHCYSSFSFPPHLSLIRDFDWLAVSTRNPPALVESLCCPPMKVKRCFVA